MLRHHGKPHITSSKQTLSHMQETKTNKIKKTIEPWWRTRDGERCGYPHRIRVIPSYTLTKLPRNPASSAASLDDGLESFCSSDDWACSFLRDCITRSICTMRKRKKRGRHKPKRKISIERFHSVILSRVVQSMKKSIDERRTTRCNHLIMKIPMEINS